MIATRSNKWTESAAPSPRRRGCRKETKLPAMLACFSSDSFFGQPRYMSSDAFTTPVQTSPSTLFHLKSKPSTPPLEPPPYPSPSTILPCRRLSSSASSRKSRHFRATACRACLLPTAPPTHLTRLRGTRNASPPKSASPSHIPPVAALLTTPAGGGDVGEEGSWKSRYAGAWKPSLRHSCSTRCVAGRGLGSSSTAAAAAPEEEEEDAPPPLLRRLLGAREGDGGRTGPKPGTTTPSGEEEVVVTRSGTRWPVERRCSTQSLAAYFLASFLRAKHWGPGWLRADGDGDGDGKVNGGGGGRVRVRDWVQRGDGDDEGTGVAGEYKRVVPVDWVAERKPGQVRRRGDGGHAGWAYGRGC